MTAQRLQKLLASAGLCSRRRAEELILEGRVSLNGAVARLGDQADLSSDRLELDGTPVGAAARTITVLLNKPRGVICSCQDPEGRTTVLDLLPPELSMGTGLHPVGRLDGASRGALLLSNDGAFTLRLTHPRFGHRKHYRVWVSGEPGPEVLEQWRRGVPLDGQPSQPVVVRELARGGRGTLLELEMGEGRNRQIRRTAELLGHPVRDLQRVAIGPLRLGDLPEGRWRHLAPQEWKDLDPRD